MSRSRFGIALALALGILCAPAAIEAQPVRRAPRIGFLGPGSIDLSTEPLRTVGPPFERWGFTFPPIPVRGPDDLDGAFATAVEERAGAISMVNSPHRS